MSEPEVQNIANFLLDRIDCLRVYISLHSYSQFWFTRWSFADVLPPDHTELVSANHCPFCEARITDKGSLQSVISKMKLFHDV